MFQINEEASDKVLEVEQKYNEIRNPVYDKRNDIIKSIPDFWLTAVSDLLLFSSTTFWEYIIFLSLLNQQIIYIYCLCCPLQFLSHPSLGELLSEEDQKV